MQPSSPVNKAVCLENAGNFNLGVDGSVTPVNFEAGPSAGNTWYIYRMGLTLIDPGQNDHNRFGAILGGITNGLQIIQRVNAADHEFTNLKQNIDIANIFTAGGHLSGINVGFINDANFFSGNAEFVQPLKLDGDNGDKIIAKVRDDLTPITKLLFLVQYWVEA